MLGPVTDAELKHVLVEGGRAPYVNGIFPRAQEEVGLSKGDALVQYLLDTAGGWVLQDTEQELKRGRQLFFFFAPPNNWGRPRFFGAGPDLVKNT